MVVHTKSTQMSKMCQNVLFQGLGLGWWFSRPTETQTVRGEGGIGVVIVQTNSNPNDQDVYKSMCLETNNQ